MRRWWPRNDGDIIELKKCLNSFDAIWAHLFKHYKVYKQYISFGQRQQCVRSPTCITINTIFLITEKRNGTSEKCGYNMYECETNTSNHTHVDSFTGVISFVF